jgi:hypothetical protein
MPDLQPSIHIQVISFGWDYPAWSGRFYPDDLPKDWHLAYYANEFSGVMVPLHLWLAADLPQLVNWADDVAEDFMFYLELSCRVDIQEALSKSQSLQTHLGGWILPRGEEGATEFVRLLLSAREHAIKCYLSDDLGRRTVGSALGGSREMGQAWCLASAELPDLRGQRSLIERLAMGDVTDSTILLIVKGQPPSVDALKQLQDLTQLMGFA